MPVRVSGRTLAIASGHDLSLALLEGEVVVAEANLPMHSGHSERLMPELRTLLRPFGGAALGPSRIVVETGPGSFTGLRIGIAAARALGQAWGCPVRGVSSTLLVAATAMARGQTGRLMVALAAPRGQIWLQAFQLPELASLGEAVALLPEDAAAATREFACLAGTAAGLPADGQTYLASAPLAAAVRLVPPRLLREAVPLYIRPGEVRAAA